MIKPIPPKFKVMIAGAVFIVGILAATRFPAEKTEKLYIAQKTESFSGSQTGSAVTLLRPTTVSSPESNEQGSVSFSTLKNTHPETYLLDIHTDHVPVYDDLQKSLPQPTTQYAAMTETSPQETLETELPEERKYQPFQGEKPTLSSLENREFQRSGPSPPVLSPTMITQEESMLAEIQSSETFPILKPVAVRPIDSRQSSLSAVVPVTASLHRASYPDSHMQSKLTGKVVTAQGSTLILPKTVSVGHYRVGGKK